MIILGFRGVHPAALLLFPLVLLLVFGGLLLLRRSGELLTTRQRTVWRMVHGVLSVLSVAGLFFLSTGYEKYLLLGYVLALGAFAALDAVLMAMLLVRTQSECHQPARRRFLAASVVLATGGLTAMAGVEASTGTDLVRTRSVRLPAPPGVIPGQELRISLLSDLHAGFYLPQEHLSQALAQVRAFAPDAVFFAGDLVEYELTSLHETRAFLESLVDLAPVYSVLGNHDCYRDSDAVARHQRELGVRVLRGEAVELEGRWGRVHLCGLPDLKEKRFSHEALKNVPDPATALLLAHNPNTVLGLPAPLVPWLAFSGHTHGGQLCLPGVGPLVNQADRRFLPGLSVVEGRRVLLTPGLGYSGLPVRLNCPPEVTNLSLA